MMTTLPPTDPVGLARQQIAASPVPWDELRDRRVLGRIEARLDAAAEGMAMPTTMEMPGERRRGRVIAIAVAGLAVAAAVLLAVFAGPWSPASSDDPSAMSLASADEFQARPEAEPSIPLEAPAEIALADGSVAQLLVAAKVDALVQEDDRVLLDQREGSVRYEVAKNPGRRFVVEAAGVEVRVIGTIFTVTIADDAHVEVSVERGLVEVVAGDRVAELGKGDSLRVPAPAADEDVLIVDDDDGLDVADTDDDGQVAVATQLRARTPRRPTGPAAGAPSIESLLEQADAARATGDLGRAASALSSLVKAHPRDPRAYSAWFQLGKVQRKRGKHAAAARAFESCWKRSPRGALAEDARAEAAASWQDAGRPERAAKAAQGYLDRYPSGTHAARMAKIASSAG